MANGSEKRSMKNKYGFVLAILLVLVLGACASQIPTPSNESTDRGRDPNRCTHANRARLLAYRRLANLDT